MKKFAFSLLLLTVLLGCKIGEDNVDPAKVYDFQTNVGILNPKPTYQIGDTLWMEINIPNQTLTDRKTGKYIALGNSLFTMSLLPIFFFEPGPAFTERFDYVSSRAFKRAESDDLEGIFTFGCPDDEYHLKIGVVFKYQGHFIFLLNRDWDAVAFQTTNPRNQIIVSDKGDCNTPATLPTDIGSVEYVFNTPDDNKAALEFYVQGIIVDPHTWNPETVQKQLDQLKLIFDNKGGFFAVVQ